MVFQLQGHRGARGLKPDNTLPSFEAALDAGVTSIETDLHLSADGQVVLCHDPEVGAKGVLVASLTLAELRTQLSAKHDPARFPRQTLTATPLAEHFAQVQGYDVFAVPTLNDLFALVTAYAGAPGISAGKTDHQRRRAEQVILDLELKRVPGRPDFIGDHFDGTRAAALEQRTIETVRRHGALPRTVIRSFDHRALLAIKSLEPAIATAVLIAGTAPARPEQLASAVGADLYCPEALYLDPWQIARLHEHAIRVLPWTVNEPADWDRLLTWGVDGITTDDPDCLAQLLNERGIAH